MRWIAHLAFFRELKVVPALSVCSVVVVATLMLFILLTLFPEQDRLPALKEIRSFFPRWPGERGS